MKPTETLARERTADGEEMTLTSRDGVYYLNLGGEVLMSSRAHGSERALATLACAPLARRSGTARPRVVIGGLGFGYTLRAALDCLPGGAEVVVVEISGMVLEANRGALGELAGRPLDDRRVRVVHGDVVAAFGQQRYDAILLDVDNGPRAFTLARNRRLYSAAGLGLIGRSLEPKGILAVWSEASDDGFRRRLEAAGFEVRVESARGHGTRGVRHTIFLARR